MFRRGHERLFSSLRSLSLEMAKNSHKLNVKPAISKDATDVLKALSETVGVDSTAPHFSFIDDPLTIPSTANAKRTYFMAREMGKRAARELAEEWPTLFAFDRDLPRLDVFRPNKTLDPLQVDPTEANLLLMIEQREVRDAGMLYERMRTEDIPVSEEVQMKLLELVAYYNGHDIPFSEWENWPGMRNFGDDKHGNRESWQNGSVADMIFETLPRNAHSTSIMIAALCKYPSKANLERARNFFKDLEKSKETPKREAFDALISVSSIKEAKMLLELMFAKKVKPTAATWNSLLISASKVEKHSDRTEAFMKILGEMQQCGMQPTLSAFQIICSGFIDRSLSSSFEESDRDTSKNKANNDVYKNQLKLAISWVSEIVGHLEKRYEQNQAIEVFSSNCHLFFVEAIGIAYRASNIDVARRIVSLYESKLNKVKMPSFITEAQFYNRYLQLFVEKCDNINEIETIYRSFVPRHVSVSRTLTKLIIEKLKKQQSWPLLRRLIEDGISSRQMTDFSVSSEFRQLLLRIEYHTLSVSEREEFSSLVQRMVSIWLEFSRFTEDHPVSKRLQAKLSPQLISDCALLLSRIGEVEKAYELLELILNEDAREGDEATVTSQGFARHEAIAELFEDALRQKDASRAATCLEIMSLNSNRSKLEPLAKRIHERCSLTEAQSRLINGFVRLRPQ
ncbi:unnamed protein product [Caenorhabditis auriculariae]|uniref:Pentacotripeptide-repeat region of PRORP domain-containing protein n=1 Tax=Caenorhabditis auriculariae TaxID=2777116 RepID=A0A8S1H6Q8_9PELO|nr:unnamed protein product [Caenorhabditis auriculariae]